MNETHNIRLPREFWEALRQASTTSGASVSETLRRWIEASPLVPPAARLALRAMDVRPGLSMATLAPAELAVVSLLRAVPSRSMSTAWLRAAWDNSHGGSSSATFHAFLTRAMDAGIIERVARGVYRATKRDW